MISASTVPQGGYVCVETIGVDHWENLKHEFQGVCYSIQLVAEPARPTKLVSVQESTAETAVQQSECLCRNLLQKLQSNKVSVCRNILQKLHVQQRECLCRNLLQKLHVQQSECSGTFCRDCSPTKLVPVQESTAETAVQQSECLCRNLLQKLHVQQSEFLCRNLLQKVHVQQREYLCRNLLQKLHIQQSEFLCRNLLQKLHVQQNECLCRNLLQMVHGTFRFIFLNIIKRFNHCASTSPNESNFRYDHLPQVLQKQTHCFRRVSGSVAKYFTLTFKCPPTHPPPTLIIIYQSKGVI